MSETTDYVLTASNHTWPSTVKPPAALNVKENTAYYYTEGPETENKETETINQSMPWMYVLHFPVVEPSVPSYLFLLG